MYHKIYANKSYLPFFLFCLTLLSSCCPAPFPCPCTKVKPPSHASEFVSEFVSDIVSVDSFLIHKETQSLVASPQYYIPDRLELPAINDINMFIQHQFYSMEYDTAQRHAVWVAYKFYSRYNEKSVKRSDAWAYDPKIPVIYQSLKKSQTYPGYDRGHLCASEDRVFDLEANKETFFFSNMSPQKGCFNQQTWKYLEEAVRKWAQSENCDTLYVVAGGAINQGVESLGKLKTRNNVTIPKYYFKALLRRQGDSFHSIAFWLENRCYSPNKITHQYAISIRELEEKTGIDFFPNLKYVLPDNPSLEDIVESSFNIEKWPL